MKNKWMMILIGVFLSTTILLGLTACDRTPPAYLENPVLKNLPKKQQKLLADIETSGIQVIKQGMQFTFVIPTDYFFDKETRALKEECDADLDRLAIFIKLYTAYFIHPQITVSGYADKVWLHAARKKMTMHYAETIATVLQEDGVSNIITVRGEGAKHPIASNHYPMGTSFNKRVEVVIH